MGGPKGLYKSNKKKKPDTGNRILNVPQRPVQPIGNEAFMNDDLIAHAGRHPMRGGGKGKPSSIPNQSMNICLPKHSRMYTNMERKPEKPVLRS